MKAPARPAKIRSAVSSTCDSSGQLNRMRTVRTTTSCAGGNRQGGEKYDAICQAASSTTVLAAACRNCVTRGLKVIDAGRSIQWLVVDRRRRRHARQIVDVHAGLVDRL